MAGADLDAQCRAILDWMERKRRSNDHQAVLLSEARDELGSAFCDKAFETLIRQGVIHAVFPESRPGDSGRQFWDFAHLTADVA